LENKEVPREVPRAVMANREVPREGPRVGHWRKPKRSAQDVDG
jgi:hypothetical protein